ncbi:MAG: SIR2 family protein [Candidatus Bathyarchaeota archaeon]
MDRLLKACVILGAGASSDIAGDGSSVILPAWRPPLAKDLFNIQGHPNYQEILAKYPGAAFLTQSLAPKISSGQISVENALRSYAEHSNALIRAHFKQIPPYIRDLIYCSSTRYTHDPSSYSQLIMDLLAEHPHELLFIVLNYDNFLESALTSFNPNHQFDSINKYTSGYDHVKVVKLHGSINWFKQIAQDRHKYSWIDAVHRTDILTPFPENEIFVIDSVTYTAEYRTTSGDRWVYPVLTAPLAGKNSSNAVCPRSHINELKQFLVNCHKFLIIGTSGLDEDLMILIDSALEYDLGANLLVHIVDYGDGADKASSRFQQSVRAFNNRIDPTNVFKSGFREYLRHTLFNSFANFGYDRG